MYIKLPMYLFFCMAFGLNDFVGAYSLLGPLEGVGPETAMSEASAIWAHKSFNGFAQIKIITSRAIKTTRHSNS